MALDEHDVVVLRRPVGSLLHEHVIDRRAAVQGQADEPRVDGVAALSQQAGVEHHPSLNCGDVIELAHGRGGFLRRALHTDRVVGETQFGIGVLIRIVQVVERRHHRHE